MHGSQLVRCALALALALGSAGCSLGDFDYLSADFGRGGGPSGEGGNAGSAAGTAGAGSGGQQLSGGMAGSGAEAGASASAGSSGTGGAAPEPYFCNSKYQVFDPSDDGEPPPVDLPGDGDYVIRKHDSATHCLLTPGWPALADKQYYAITQACEAPATPSPTEPTEIWHFERLCSDVYRLSTLHGAAGERQLGVVDQSEVGTPLYTVAETSHDDPSLLFQLRFEEVIPEKQLVRWRISPLITPSSCIEQVGQARYGEVDVTRVVLYPCTGNALNQSWNLLALP